MNAALLFAAMFALTALFLTMFWSAKLGINIGCLGSVLIAVVVFVVEYLVCAYGSDRLFGASAITYVAITGISIIVNLVSK